MLSRLLGFGGSLSKKDLGKIEEVVEVCSDDCGACSYDDNAEVSKAEANYSKLKIDMDGALFGSSKSSKVHFIVPTSQTDWAHDACSEKRGSVQDKLATWIDNNKSKFTKTKAAGDVLRCSVSSLPIDIMDLDVMRGEKNNILVLPHFLWIQDVKATQIGSLLDEYVPLLVDNKRDELLSKENVIEAKQESFMFLCSHKTRDKRCGVTAPVLKRFMDQELQTHGLYRDASDFSPNGATVAYINHVGGHKFAANVVIYLRKSHSMVWLARVSPKHVKAIVDNIILPDTPKLPWPEKVRCVEKYGEW
ncbi:LAMI_0B06898g1_1 [Lachancea mirantina]|uniref:LAMI_0B06898g1_1 n=1 Tax=Lachancea mirantina TaxID=1230905 RepID=A0A1G4IX05_9SACH|nr:LAMI_0B06898g1_1 [Lachancea mirantina]